MEIRYHIHGHRYTMFMLAACQNFHIHCPIKLILADCFVWKKVFLCFIESWSHIFLRQFPVCQSVNRSKSHIFTNLGSIFFILYESYACQNMGPRFDFISAYTRGFKKKRYEKTLMLAVGFEPGSPA